MFLLYGIAETFSYRLGKKGSESKSVNKEKDSVDDLSEAMKSHEQVVKSTMETTLALMAASQNFINHHKNKNGKQNDITAEPKS
jgi:hypothetical protein